MNEIWANRLIAETQTWEKCVRAGRADAVKAILKSRVNKGILSEEKFKQIIGE